MANGKGESEPYVLTAEDAKNDERGGFFAKKIFKEGDVLLEWNGSEVSIESFQNIIQSFYSNTEAGDKITVLVRREVKGKTKEVKLKAKAKKVKSSQRHQLNVIENPSPEQQKIRAIWLGEV